MQRNSSVKETAFFFENLKEQEKQDKLSEWKNKQPVENS